ncbi:MAG TPA: hypothetical protein VHP32_05200 [Ignavibacteria bacterium]|nr:hypothetical protein [Ignavibacteria bacterium]
MIPELRKKYNAEFTYEKYKKFLEALDKEFDTEIEFRISETPVFITPKFKNELIKAADDILNFLQSDKFKEISKKAIPPGLEVPNESAHTDVLAIDFAVGLDKNGNYIPQLIELQGFPSLYCYQEILNQKFKEYFNIPENYAHYFNGLNHETYIQKLKEVLIGDSNPENVILLEIEPEKQKTYIDFLATERMLGISPVCLTKIQKEGKKLFYEKNGKKIPIERIYNRVIYDELKGRKDIKYNFKFTEDLDVKWVTHPNWFFKISKYLLPFIESKYVPKSYFVNELKEIPSDLENYVLKPLYSFAGAGVKFDVTSEDITSIPENEKHNYVLQRKIVFSPCVETLDEPAKAEIRLLAVWPQNGKPELMINLVRMGKGKMMGVDFNKNKTWVGSSIGYFKQ